MTDNNLHQKIQQLQWQLQKKEQELQEKDEKIYENGVQIQTKNGVVKEHYCGR